MMSADVIPFPMWRVRRSTPALSTVAAAIYRDMQSRAGQDPNGIFRHSVNDGIHCSGALRHKVVLARKELQQRGLVTMLEPGDGNGAAVWSLSRQSAEPDGAA